MNSKKTSDTLDPQFTRPTDLERTIREHGYALVSPEDVLTFIKTSSHELSAFSESWNTLTPDQYLKDGGRYRKRRHASLKIISDDIEVVPHRAHWQPETYNALHGGMHRWFDPIETNILSSNVMTSLLSWLSSLASKLDGETTWYGETHQFRIDTTHGIGRPTPEGAHRDGVDWVAVFLICRNNIKGGETRVFAVDNPNGQRFTLKEPWSLLLLNDRRMIHETTPIQPTANEGWRDTLVMTLRSKSFLDDSA